MAISGRCLLLQLLFVAIGCLCRVTAQVVSNSPPVADYLKRVQLEDIDSAKFPEPYFLGALQAGGVSGGYQPFSGVAGAGLDLERPYLVTSFEASADNAHKVDSGTGHSAHLMGRAFYRLHSGLENAVYLGAGAQWSKLSTDQYSKQGWRPTYGGGVDINRNQYSFRTQVMYVTTGTDHLNGVHGPEITLWIPSPSEHAHWFARIRIEQYWFHQTSTPYNSGTSIRGSTGWASVAVMYRF
jgi:hypothetical protein